MSAANRQFDAIIVGSGPGGASVARALSLRGKHVLVLEAGSDAPVDDSLWTQARVMRMNFIGGGVPIIKGITSGGTSMLYFACAVEPPLDLFRRHGIELAEYVEQVRKEVPIAPIPEQAIGPRARRIFQSARDLGYDWEPIQKFVYARRCDTSVPYNARWNARSFVQEACRNGAVLETRANVTRILSDDLGVRAVEFRQSGATHRAEAEVVVLAAGGVGSAQLLRASGIERAGRGFFCDPVISVSGAVDGIDAAREHPMVAGVLSSDEGFMLADMTLHPAQYWLSAAQRLHLDQLPHYRKALTIMVKARDEIDGTISRKGRVRRTFSHEDQERLRRGRECASEILENAGAKRIFHSFPIGAHPGGTARVGDVVDANLQTEIEGLFVCDCSVIPEPWGRPPSLTLLALGSRLAAYLDA